MAALRNSAQQGKPFGETEVRHKAAVTERADPA